MESSMVAIPAKRDSKFNESITANTDILSSDITPYTVPSYLRIYVTFDTSGILTLRRTNSGTTINENLVGEGTGGSLVENVPYIFDIVTDEGETYNLQYSVDATLLKLIILEIDRGI